jgi:peptide/nickel transport system substrate-binding protein
MIRRLLSFILALGALASPANAKDELVLAMTQMPGTWNPIISSMLAKSLIANMTARPVTAYDADWKLVCLVCVELPTLDNGKARVVDLADGKKGMEIDVELRDMRWGDGTPVSAKDVAFTLEVGQHPLSGVASSEGYKRIIKLDVKDDRRFTMTIDRVTFDYNSIGLQLLPAHIEKPIFDANPAEYRNRTAYDTQSTNPGLAFGPFRLTEIVPGSRVVLEQNPTWTGQKPHFKRITVRIIENTAALEANLLSGSVDYVLGELGLSLDQAIAFEKRHKEKYDVVYKPALIWEHIDVNLDNKLLADRRVRQAMLLAIDRKAISEKLFEGKQPIAHGGISDLDPMFSPSARQYGYDPRGRPQAAGRGRLLDPPQQRPTQCGRRQVVDRAGHHRRQPGARTGGAGDPEPAPPGRYRSPPQGRATARLLRSDGQADLQRSGHVCLGAAPRGRAALVPSFQGNPFGRQRLERPELSRLRQSRDGQGAGCRRART